MRNVIKCIGVVVALWMLLAVVWVGTNAGAFIAETPMVKPVHIPIYKCLDKYCNKYDKKDMNV